MKFFSRLNICFSLNKRNLQFVKRYQHQSNIDIEDVVRHSHLAGDWWNPTGPMKALHSMNQIRVPFIRDGLVATGKVDKQYANTSQSLKNLKLLEVGCGAGILTEPLARLHANVTAIDPGEDVITAAKDHLDLYSDKELKNRISYRNESLENHLTNHTNKYDAVIVSEVLEHVNDKQAFLSACVNTLKPGGSIFITTFNKTYLSWLGGIILAENVFKLVPKDTHDWNKFIPPLETQRLLDECGCSTCLLNGFTYEIWRNKWRWISSTQFSYALQAVKH